MVLVANPECGKIGKDCSLTAVQRKTAFVDQSWLMMAWIWHVWINAIMLVPAAKAPPKAGAKELSYNSLNVAYSGHPSGHPCFGPNWFTQFCHTWRWIRYAQKSSPRETGKGRHWTPLFFCGCASNGQDSPKASPRVIFSWKNFIEQLNLIAHMNADWKVEKAQYAEFNVPTLTTVQRKIAFVEQSWFTMAWT